MFAGISPSKAFSPSSLEVNPMSSIVYGPNCVAFRSIERAIASVSKTLSDREVTVIRKLKGASLTHTLKRLVILGLIAVSAFSTRSFSQPSDSPKESVTVLPHGRSFKGKHERNFVLKDLSGKTISLRDYAGKPVIVNFWATWCTPCLLEMPSLEELSRKYAGSGLTVLGLTVDVELNSATPQKIAATTKRLGVSYPIVISDRSIHRLYGPVHLLPATFYINREGVIVEDVWGHPDKVTMEKYIREIVG
jgi:thiol-disulfide isomerase/thioredoxin